MKKKKLALSKITISNLNYEEQMQVKAGYVSATCPERCNTYPQDCTAGCPSVNWRYCAPTEADTCSPC
ncbi:MAG TPA: class I lanthipeptide [Candidatus Deferrimicrobium sp.]|nr:class I lanthipeptide [Candidatus Kapabacteria bacterium]HLP58855.1 class I lanthipeptide [Candidatus Deferrimicrobium sp.]